MDTRDAREGAALLQRTLDILARHAMHIDTVAIVVLSALPVQETLDILDKAGVLQGSLHAIVADAGASVNVHTARRQNLVASEDWKKHISFRWLVRGCVVWRSRAAMC